MKKILVLILVGASSAIFCSDASDSKERLFNQVPPVSHEQIFSAMDVKEQERGGADSVTLLSQASQQYRLRTVSFFTGFATGLSAQIGSSLRSGFTRGLSGKLSSDNAKAALYVVTGLSALRMFSQPNSITKVFGGTEESSVVRNFVTNGLVLGSVAAAGAYITNIPLNKDTAQAIVIGLGATAILTRLGGCLLSKWEKSSGTRA